MTATGANLNQQSATIAEVLRAGGIALTCAANGTSLAFDGRSADKSNWPVQRGFEKFYGTIRGGGSFYDPTASAARTPSSRPQNDPEYKPEKFYYTDAISDNAVRFLQQHEQGVARQTVLHVCRLHRRALADARAGEGHCQIQRQVRRRLRAGSQKRGSSG